ncbi:cytochrome P450 [Apodospora peruviana]|uniref:Cytochrome P450 n=1 Tax=Apodospora peruviana TaxID=516989 RepID=A0AAE0HZD9_9PEZI|nr:cytochrome P450 [Apodospora peruviana]
MQPTTDEAATTTASGSPFASQTDASSRPSEQHHAETRFTQERIDSSAAIISDNVAEIHSEYDLFRQSCPIAYTTQYSGYYLLTRYHDIKAAALDSTTFISSVRAVIPSDPRGLRRPPLNFDAPAHTPYRTALDRTLKPARVKRLAAPLERHAEVLLAPLLTAKGGNICTEFATDFAAWVETEWLNLEPETAPKLARTASAWVDAWRRMDGEKTTFYSTALYDISRSVLDDRRRSPRDPEEDPASSLLSERGPDGEPLEEMHLVGCIRQSLVVGMVAPPLMLGGICNYLSEHQDLQQQLRDDPSLIPAAMEEFVRLFSPYRGFARTVSKDVVIHGQTIKPGIPISMTYSAANRDPVVFDDPHTFILNRPNISMHVGFGRGRHRCVGQPLARLALQTALTVLLRRTKKFKVNGELQFARMPEMGIISCPLVFT